MSEKSRNDYALERNLTLIRHSSSDNNGALKEARRLARLVKAYVEKGGSTVQILVQSTPEVTSLRATVHELLSVIRVLKDELFYRSSDSHDEIGLANETLKKFEGEK